MAEAAVAAVAEHAGKAERQPLAGRDWKSVLKDDIKSRHFISGKAEEERERIAADIVKTLASIVETRPLLKRLVESGMAEPKFFETATRSCQEKLDLIGWDKLTFKVVVAEMETRKKRRYAVGLISKDEEVDFPRLFSMLRECKQMAITRHMLKPMVTLVKEPLSDTEFGTFTPFFTARNMGEIDHIILEEPRGDERENKIIDFSIGGTGMAKQFSVHMHGYRAFFGEMLKEYEDRMIVVPWIPVK